MKPEKCNSFIIFCKNKVDTNINAIRDWQRKKRSWIEMRKTIGKRGLSKKRLCYQ